MGVSMRSRAGVGAGNRQFENAFEGSRKIYFLFCSMEQIGVS